MFRIKLRQFSIKGTRIVNKLIILEEKEALVVSNPEAVAATLLQTVEEAVTRLRSIAPERTTFKPSEATWSAREVLGHLLDSAVNNHQRFVRAQQVSELTFPGYEQTFWVSSQHYQERPWLELLELWHLYNRHLAHVIRQIPADQWDTPCTIGTSETVTLGFIVEDYLPHLKHHLSQIWQRT